MSRAAIGDWGLGTGDRLPGIGGVTETEGGGDAGTRGRGDRSGIGRRFWVVSLLLVAAAASCASPTPVPLPPKEIIARAAGRMNALPGFYFVIERSGAPAFLDPGETISFRRAEGFYAAPDRARATVRVIGPGLVTDVDVISIGRTQWETNLLSGEWQELPPDWGFNPAVLFDAKIGIQSILAADVSGLTLEGTEKLDDGPDVPLYVISGSLAGSRLHELSYGLIGPETMTARVWVAPESYELHRALVTDPNEGPDAATVWQVDFSQFGRTVQIDPPAAGS